MISASMSHHNLKVHRIAKNSLPETDLASSSHAGKLLDVLRFTKKFERDVRA